MDAEDKSVKITVSLPSKHLLDLCARAEAERRPLRELVRELLKPTKPKQ